MEMAKYRRRESVAPTVTAVQFAQDVVAVVPPPRCESLSARLTVAQPIRRGDWLIIHGESQSILGEVAFEASYERVPGGYLTHYRRRAPTVEAYRVLRDLQAPCGFPICAISLGSYLVFENGEVSWMSGTDFDKTFCRV